MMVLRPDMDLALALAIVLLRLPRFAAASTTCPGHMIHVSMAQVLSAPATIVRFAEHGDRVVTTIEALHAGHWPRAGASKGGACLGLKRVERREALRGHGEALADEHLVALALAQVRQKSPRPRVAERGHKGPVVKAPPVPSGRMHAQGWCVRCAGLAAVWRNGPACLYMHAGIQTQCTSSQHETESDGKQA